MIDDAIYLNLFISAFILLLVYMLDRWDKEPLFFVSKLYLISIFFTFLFGKLKFGLLGSPVSQLSPLVDSFIIAALLEESLKFTVFMIFVWRNKNFNEEMDGIIYCMVIAAGFAVMENINYTLNYTLYPFLYGVSTGRHA